VIAATNRPDVLDPALLRSGRLDRKIELPHPSEDARARIMEIHSRKMNVDKVRCGAYRYRERRPHRGVVLLDARSPRSCFRARVCGRSVPFTLI
jgi:SpoVK/Ycf46/Vps4 family AAA+-type ATPase